MTPDVGEEATTSSALETRNTGGCYCSVCGAELEAGQPVVRTKEPGVRRFAFFCLEHSPYLPDGELLHETSCAHCSRTIWLDVEFVWRAFCSERCRWTSSNERARERRWAARVSSCAECGKRMEGFRRDTLYCTDKCRQRAYRGRQKLSA